MQPFYDSYPAAITLAGGIPVIVSLTIDEKISGQWELNMLELEKSITPKSKMIIVNNPHNPTGKVFNRTELTALAEFASRHKLLVLADEVYETLAFKPMIKFASLPGMYERTITVGSIGKMFGILILI